MEIPIAILARGARETFLDAANVAFRLYRVMIPLVIGIKILVELDLVGKLAVPLKPLMGLMGLPADLGLVWAFAVVVNIYAALIALAGLLPVLPPLSVAQTTTLGVVMLIAHGLIVESRVARECGVSFCGQVVLRFSGALLCGMLMHLVYSYAGILQEPARILLQTPENRPDLWEWARGEAANLFCIFWIITGLMFLQRFLRCSRADRLLARIFSPLLMLLGLSSGAATCIVVGFTMGLLYGSGILIKESRAGTLSPRDVFCSITLIGLCHALIEDTLLMLLIGGHLSGLIGIRLAFSLAFSLFVTRLYVFFARPHCMDE
jgi:hypothetical protein